MVEPKDPALVEENSEQTDEGQAQDVASDAQHLEETSGSERGGHADRYKLVPDDAPDLVDRMEQMVSSGIIDDGAFDGEPHHDDEDESDEDEG